MNKDQAASFTLTLVKAASGYGIAHGIGTSSTWATIGSVAAMLVAAFVSHAMHTDDEQPAAKPPLRPLLVLAFLCLVMGVTGCASNSKGHVIRTVGTGTKLGITQNPATGAYELGFSRVQIEAVVIPVFFTNGAYASPEVVSRYEVSSHSAVFGNVMLTSTLSTGTNAVATSVGGATPPINTGVGTGANLTPLSH